MSKIALETEAYSIGGEGTPAANKCCTKSRAEALGCNVSGSYANNQLVQLADLAAADTGFGTHNIVVICSLIGDNLTSHNDDLRFAVGFTLQNGGSSLFYSEAYDEDIVGTYSRVHCYDASQIGMMISDLYTTTTISLLQNECACYVTTWDGDMVWLNVNVELVNLGSTRISTINKTLNVQGSKAEDLELTTSNVEDLMTFDNMTGDVTMSGNADWAYAFNQSDGTMNGVGIWLYAWL